MSNQGPVQYDWADDQMPEPAQVAIAVERAERLFEQAELYQYVKREHAALLDLAAEVVRAYRPQPGVFVEVEDDRLDAALDALQDWIVDHHHDWQG